jgi:hypothetical protein
MTRGGFPTGQGLTLRVYEVLADGTRRDVEPEVHTYGSRPIVRPTTSVHGSDRAKTP